MDRAAALAVLGVDDTTPPDAVRRRYLALLREHHPDVAAAPGTIDPAAVTDAYRVVRATEAPPASTVPGVAIAVDAAGDTVVIGLPPDEAFLALLDTASTIGAVTYVDPDVGLLETRVSLSSGSTCSVVISLQGRATGTTDAFCTVEALGPEHAPPVGRLVEEIATFLRESLNS